ncbi:unnamed protein product [Didymodactylos carnosus]|uniref:Uncharacterized protein n=1 Tax=Didymodactylos carnosus TaxID=1234261 RepID=A0A814VVK7_9BILA|nr:unnamed protein product [Didymodactylos carnosus]CAF1196384.1 unnamed protein product [Didymodactylos carnosus]CAF3823974.1 unnamed protein product [Didymodactylos carnosus]CAF3960727.1 unnamed protein product [Didymodactylos carnosus]
MKFLVNKFLLMISGHSRYKTAPRFLEPEDPNNEFPKLDPQWDGWLRGTRKLPPTEDEIAKYERRYQRLSEKEVFMDPSSYGLASPSGSEKPYPTRPEYEHSGIEKSFQYIHRVKKIENSRSSCFRMNGNDISDNNNNYHSNTSPSNLLTRTTIREANIHLQLLHSRNQELEKILETQQQTIKRQEDALMKKDQDYMELCKKLRFLERHCENLQLLLHEKDKRLIIYDRKDAIFSETLELRPAIEQLLDILNTFELEDQIVSVNMNNSIQHLINHNSKTTTNAIISNKIPLEFVQNKNGLSKHTINDNFTTKKITRRLEKQQQRYRVQKELFSQPQLNDEQWSTVSDDQEQQNKTATTTQINLEN